MRFLLTTVFALIFGLSGPAQNSTQSAPSEREALFQKLRTEVFRGNKWALRDLAFFLDDKKEWSDLAWHSLRQFCAFAPDEFDLGNKPDKQAFLDFFYKNLEKLYFDELLNIWSLTPLEKTALRSFDAQALPAPIAPDKVFKSAVQNLRHSFETGDTAVFHQSIHQLAEIRSQNAWQILIETAREGQKLDAAPWPAKFSARLSLLRALQFCPLDEALALALGWLRSGAVTADDAEIPISELSNHFINKVTTADILAKIGGLRDSLGSLDALRQHGYDILLPFEPQFFFEPVDFYGFALAFIGPQPWARHGAAESLLASRHPRSLYYLATRVFRNRFDFEDDAAPERYLSSLLAPLERLTCVKILVPDAQSKLSAAALDRTWLLNYVRYWAQHWPDYDWDERRGYFVNKFKAETLTESYDRLFRRLSAANDSVAMASFRSLTEGDPTEILPLTEQYRQTMRQVNGSLPSFKYRFLEQMALLTAFCGEAGFDWKPGPTLAAFLEKLLAEPSPEDRYLIENQMIESLTLADATALEYEALLRESDRAFSFSAARVLDYLYTRHWPELCGDLAQLRFFLKKSALFAGIGTTGACNFYPNKFAPPLAENLPDMLEHLAANETDEDIARLAKSILKKTSAPLGQVAPENPTLASASEFEAKLAHLQKADSLSAEDFNFVFASGRYRPEQHKSLVLQAFARLKPAAQLRRLNPNPKFSLRSDFRFFENISLKTKELASLLRMFNGDDPERALAWLWQKTADLEGDARAAVFNEALRTDWLRRHFNQLAGADTTSLAIHDLLRAWFEANENLSDFEAESALLHLVLLANVGKPAAAKLQATFDLDASEPVKAKIQREILSVLAFSDLISVVPLLPRLSPDEQGQPGHFFLTKDFGLPPFAFSDNPDNALLADKLAKLAEPEVYKFYLRKMGVPFENPATKSLDFQAIHRTLKFDLLTPFAGAGGERRDWFVFAVVKLCEFHFGDRLGFPEKLNENQTFYTFNAGKRAAAWAAFLEEKGLVKSGERRSWLK